MSVDDYLDIGVAMVAKRHELNYIAATFANDDLIIGTWIEQMTIVSTVNAIPNHPIC
ncbi:MAG: hypothetical protein CM1200mP10_25680 [Candidatus Neomarinimicrobiota bacterium]|nr:MAG: hypothetical protein CM1200mP10_25680 [Candidatus Neomarinimicrobiota bacterium]